MSPLRVDFIFPRFKLLSGAERAILGLAAALDSAGHRVRVVCHQFDDSCRPRLVPGVELVCTNLRLDRTSNRYLNAIFDYSMSLRLRRVLDPSADVQMLFGPALPLVLLSRGLRRFRARVIYYCWEPPRVLYQDREAVLIRLGWYRYVVAPLLGVYAACDRRLVGLADAVCTSSPFSAKQVEACYGRPVSVITLGVDRQRLDTVRGVAPEQPPSILTVNYLHPRKRVDLFVRAASVFSERQHDDMYHPTWIIVGDGPERAHLEQLVCELGLETRVQFAGFVSDDELPRYYASSTCYVHVGLEESFGLSVIEAAYCGRPVVAVDEGGVRENVSHGVTGYRVAPTAFAIAEAVGAVLSQTDGGQAMGIAGYEQVVDRYTWEQGAAEIVQLSEAVSQ